MSQRITFTETSYGHYMPVVVTTSAGVETVRELTKADLNQFESVGVSLTEGYLYKKGVNHKHWAKRFFTLHGRFLFYFHDAQDTKPIGVLPLRGCRIELLDHRQAEQQLQQQQLRHGFAFKIVDNTPKKQVFHLFAETESERQRWVDAITSALCDEPETAPPAELDVQAKLEDAQIDSTPGRKNASLAVLRAAVSRHRTEALAETTAESQSSLMSSGRKGNGSARPTFAQTLAGSSTVSHPFLTREHTDSADEVQIQAIAAARVIEEECPITFSELLRNQVYTMNIPMCEQAQEGSPVNIPHMKGDWAEQLLIDVYRRYCSAQGFMGLEQFTEFLNDAAVVSSHLPRTEDDEPDEVLQRMLEPATLMASLPENLGLGLDDSFAGPNTRLNFTQFFLLLVNIASIVYEEQYAHSMAAATGRLVQEVVVPLYTWAQGHDKRGSNDDAVLETRILLLLQGYASNLWIVFLYYATDHFVHSPSLKLPFPGATQYQERLVHGMPRGIVPSKAINDYLATHDGKNEVPQQSLASSAPKGGRKTRPLALSITEASALRFAREYGIMPQLISRAELRELFQQVNRPKNIPSDRKGFGVTQITVNECNGNAALGLSFSEFGEFIVRIALQGMMQKHYHAIFNTPYAKVAALLTQWGVASLARLEEVKLMNTFNVNI